MKILQRFLIYFCMQFSLLFISDISVECCYYTPFKIFPFKKIESNHVKMF